MNVNVCGNPIHFGLAVVTPPAVEPVSRTEAKLQTKIDVTADDALVDALILAARTQVENDTGRSLVATVWDYTLDSFPAGGRPVVVPVAPLVSVASIKSTDTADAETTMSASDYVVDTASNRIFLAQNATWPSGLRTYKAGVVRFTAGYSGSAKTVSSITRSSTTATVTTSGAHGYTTGKRITIAGSDQADYNGTVEITVTGAATFTYTVANSPTTPATGTMTATDLGVPQPLLQAILLLVGHWYLRREAVVIDQIATEVPLAYSALIAPYVLLGTA